MNTDWFKGKTGAAYMRVSDATQKIERQRAAVERWLSQNGLTIPRGNWFVDEDWTRSEAEVRPDFVRLLADAEAGRIQWIVIDDQDRFEAGDEYEFFAILHRLRKARCRLYVIDGRELTNLSNDVSTGLTTYLDSNNSRKEGMSKAKRVLEAQVRLAQLGQWLGGPVPYGMDVVALDAATGREHWRVIVEGKHARLKVSVDGVKERFDGPHNFPSPSATQVFQLRPSVHEDRLKVVRDMYNWMATETINCHQIALRLNGLKVARPTGGMWQGRSVEYVLRSSVYVGYMTWAKGSSGKYKEFIGGKVVDVETPFPRPRDKSEWIRSGQIFEPVVDPELWEKVQRKLDAIDAKEIKRSPKSPTLWLSGLLVCGHCGREMRGHSRRGWHGYICATYNDATSYNTEKRCGRNAVEHATVERYLRTYLADQGAAIFGPGAGQTKRELPRHVSQLMKRYWDQHAAVRKRLGIENPNAMSFDELLTRYVAMYDAESPALREERATLEAEHDDLTNKIYKLPDGSLAMRKAHAKLAELEGRIASIDQKLELTAAGLEDAAREVAVQFRSWANAQEAVEAESGSRRKSDAVRAVVAQIEATFRPTGLRRPIVELDTLRFVPVGGVQSLEPNVRTGSPGTS